MPLAITNGKKVTPKRTVIYGPEGLGKTELGKTFPKPVYVDVEEGSLDIDVNRVLPKSMGEINSTVQSLKKDDHDFQTVVFDTIDWIERYMMIDLCSKYGVDSIEKIEGGYGKGYTILEEEMMGFLTSLDKLRKARGLNIVLLAHSEIKKHEDPILAASYDRHKLKLQKKTAPLVKEWADALLFYDFKTLTADREGSMNSKRGVQKHRVLYTERTAAFDAKNRCDLPSEIAVKKRHVMPKELGALFEFSDSNKSKKSETAKSKSEPEPEPSAEDWKLELEGLVDLCGGEDAVNAFLETRNKVLSEIDEEYANRLLDNREEFVKAVEAHSAK